MKKETVKNCIRYTSRVRRGLALMGAVCSMVMEDDEPSALEQMKKWTRSQHDDFQQACRWVRQEVEAAQRKELKGEVSLVAPPPTSP